MLAWMDDEALHRTLTTGRATYWSRSRGEYWVKGETSGNRQWVREVRLDCDGDALLVLVDQEGAACHTGDRSCFFRPLPAVQGAASMRFGVTSPAREEFAALDRPVVRGHGAGHPAAARRQRDRRRRLPQAGGQPAGHGAARVGRAGQAVGRATASSGARSAGVLTERDGVTQWLGEPIPGLTDDLPADPLEAVRVAGPPAAHAADRRTCRR